MDKLLTETGQKARQRDDNEDRSLSYRDWLRTVETNGFFIDIDLVKWRNENGNLRPVVITELTRCDGDDAGEEYRAAIIDRYCYRDKQFDLINKLRYLLGKKKFDTKYVEPVVKTNEEYEQFMEEFPAMSTDDMKWIDENVTDEMVESVIPIPAYLVLFQKDMKWIWAWSFAKKAWKYFTPDNWATFLQTL
jgi:hypothetical protein